MANKESNLLNMVLTLLVVTLVASTALGFVYEFTKEPIAQARKAKKERAISQVVPTFDNKPLETATTLEVDGGELEVYTATKGSQPVGTAIKTFSNKGYSGKIAIMVGFTANGTIHNIEVLEHKETPGLGTKMADPKFKDQFVGKNPEKSNLNVVKDGGTIDAISGATISSRAFSDATNRAYKAFKNQQAEKK